MPPRWQPSLEDYVDLAAHLLGADRAAVAALPRVPLAESALPRRSPHSAAPRPTRRWSSRPPCYSHLVKSHPLPDANKRAAFLLTARFLDANGLHWGPPDADIDAGLVERVAAGEAQHEEVIEWILARIRDNGDEQPSSTARR